MAVSSEKITLLTELADDVQRQRRGRARRRRASSCDPPRKASGAAANAIVEGWPDPEPTAPQPVIWSPAASAWGAIVNERAGAEHGPGRHAVHADAARHRHAASRWPRRSAIPSTPVGFADIVDARRTNPEGWAAVGHPEWGPFRLGKTNPNFSTSGLNFTIAEYYAATGKTSGLTIEDLDRARRRQQFAQRRRVGRRPLRRHHDDVPQQLVRRRSRAARRSPTRRAVAVEEKSVIDYNLGNPDGVLAPGETPRVPRVPLVAIYPKEGTLFSDSPFIILDTDWVTPTSSGRRRSCSRSSCSGPRTSRRCSSSASARTTRPCRSPTPISAGQRRRPDPADGRARGARRRRCWSACSTRGPSSARTARVLLVLDVSGSMGDPATATTARPEARPRPAGRGRAPSTSSRTPTRSACGCSRTDLLGRPDPNYRELVPIGADRANRDVHRRRDHAPSSRRNGTPLYDVDAASRTRRCSTATTRRRSTPSCCSPTARTTTATLDDDDAAVRRPDRDAAVGQRGRVVAPGPGVHDLLRRRRRHRSTLRAIAQATIGRALRRQQPGHDRAGVHRRDLELLTATSRWPDARSATASSPRGWPGDDVAARHRAVRRRRRRRRSSSGLPIALAAGDRCARLGRAGARRRPRRRHRAASVEPERAERAVAGATSRPPRTSKARFDRVVAGSGRRAAPRAARRAVAAGSTTASPSRGASPDAATRSSSAHRQARHRVSAQPSWHDCGADRARPSGMQAPTRSEAQTIAGAGGAARVGAIGSTSSPIDSRDRLRLLDARFDELRRPRRRGQRRRRRHRRCSATTSTGSSPSSSRCAWRSRRRTRRPGSPAALRRARAACRHRESSTCCRSNLVVATGTTLSRLTGLLRVVVFGDVIGQTALADAYTHRQRDPEHRLRAAARRRAVGDARAAVHLVRRRTTTTRESTTNVVITVAARAHGRAHRRRRRSPRRSIFRLYTLDAERRRRPRGVPRRSARLLTRIFLCRSSSTGSPGSPTRS